MKKFLLFICCILFVACAPRSKADYMTKFGEFMTEVSSKYDIYDDRDWEKMDKKYQKFTGEWYDKFENELTLKDELKVASYQAKWAVYRNLNDVSSVVKEVLNSDETREVREGVKNYIKNDMGEDLRTIEKESRQVAEDIAKEVHEVIDEFSENMDK